tara:strand:- start:571 stop:894 length:324 start_codon:yes stop_codon:yes gene_type:complete
VLFIAITLSKNLYAQMNYETLFYQSLSKWKINYKSLEGHKAGAACINKEITNVNKIEALGFSFQSYDINYAKEVAMTGCKQMKKKKILKDCKCEIIIVNDKAIKEIK